MNILTPPSTDEYAEFYADYIQRAKRRNDLNGALILQIEEIRSAIGTLSDKQSPLQTRAQGVVHQGSDRASQRCRRVFSYRLLRISRNDPTPLPGFEQEEYVRAAGFDRVPLEDLVGEFECLRRANLLAIRHMSEEAVEQRGTASGASVSARALVHMLAGHVDHHLESLREKYLPTAVTL